MWLGQVWLSILTDEFPGVIDVELHRGGAIVSCSHNVVSQLWDHQLHGWHQLGFEVIMAEFLSLFFSTTFAICNLVLLTSSWRRRSSYSTSVKTVLLLLAHPDAVLACKTAFSPYFPLTFMTWCMQSSGFHFYSSHFSSQHPYSVDRRSFTVTVVSDLQTSYIWSHVKERFGKTQVVMWHLLINVG